MGFGTFITEKLPDPTFTKPATYNKVKRISVEVMPPGQNWPVDVLRLEKGGNAGWVLVLPAVHGYGYKESKPRKVLSIPYTLKFAKALATALIREAGSLARFEELRADICRIGQWRQGRIYYEH